MTEQAETDIVERVHEKATSLEHQVEKLEEFRSDLEKKSDQVERMGPREQQAFYSNASSLRENLETINTVDELLALEDTIEDLIRSPLREAALSELDSFLEVVDPELSSETEEEVREKIGNSLPQDLEKITESYQELTPLMRELPEFLTSHVQAAIEERPSILTDPGGAPRELLEQLNNRRDILQELDEVLAGSGGWTPNTTLASQEELYDSLDYMPAAGKAKKQIREIDQLIEDIEGIGLQVSGLVNEELVRELNDATAESFINPFSSVHGELYALNNAYQNVSDWINDLQAFGKDQGVFEDEIDELLTEHEQLKIREFDSVEALRNRCHSLRDDLRTFIGTLAEQLKIKRQMKEDILEVLDEVQSPEIDFPTDSTGQITPQSVRPDLEGALNSLLELDDWFENAFAELGGSFDNDAYEIWKQLYEGDEVSLTPDNQETIVTLANQFSINVVLGSE